MWNHSHSNHSSPAGGQQQSTIQQPGSTGISSPCLNRLQERFDIYRNHSNDQEKKYESTFKIMNDKSMEETNRLREQHLITVNSTNNKPTGSRKQATSNKNGSNSSNKRSNPDNGGGGGGGQRCVKSVKQEEDNKVVSVKVPKLAKITPKVVKVEPEIKVESPTIKSEQVYCPLVTPQNGLLMTQTDHFSLEGLTDNVAIGEEELLKLYEELGGTMTNDLVMMSQQPPINNTAHQQSGINYNQQVVIGRPQFVNSQPPQQQQQLYQRFPPQINRPPQFQQQFNDQQQSRFNVQPQMNGPPLLNGQNQMNGHPIVNGQPQMNGQSQLNCPPQINGQTQLNGQPHMNGQPHFNGQQPQLNVQQLPSNCIQRDPQQHQPTSQGHHVHVQSNGPRQHFEGQQQSQQQFNGQQQVNHQFNGQQQQSHQSQQFSGPPQHHVHQHQQQNGQQFQQQQSWYQYQAFQ